MQTDLHHKYNKHLQILIHRRISSNSKSSKHNKCLICKNNINNSKFNNNNNNSSNNNNNNKSKDQAKSLPTLSKPTQVALTRIQFGTTKTHKIKFKVPSLQQICKYGAMINISQEICQLHGHKINNISL